jgi:hypothetical protein
MKISQLVFQLGHCLAECETKLIEAQLEQGIAGLCRSLGRTIESCAYVPIDSFEAVALGIAQAACPLHHDGLCDSLILDGLRDAGLKENHAALSRLLKDIRLWLVVERMSPESGLTAHTVQMVRDINGTAGDRELLVLDKLIEQATTKLPSAMKTASLDAKVKLLLGLGIHPRAILTRVSEAL